MLNSILVAVVSALFIFYWLVKKRYNFWRSREILQTEPKFPLGDIQGISTSKHPADIFGDIYHKYVGKGPFVGAYCFLSPIAVILDPELIKNIMIRDFSNFPDRGFYYNEKDDPISANLFFIEGKKWKNLRSKLTPTFTSGKMKMMFPTVALFAEKMTDHMKELVESKAIVDIKDVLGRYSTDVIGTTAFGIECKSLEDANVGFRFYGKQVFDPPKIQALKVLFGSAYPKLCRKLGIKLFDSKVSEFFYKMTESNVDYRSANKIERPDFLHMLMNLDEKLNMDELAAQSFLFFLAGFETSSSTMQFCLYEMALNQEIQNRAREEILQAIEKCDGKITYEAALNLPYLDQCINETLRKYPTVENLFRNTINDYQVPGTKDIIPRGTRVCIPVWGMQHDPNIYPDPEVFDPERFTEENIKTRHQFTYLPFGEGPRICIGMRFGLMQSRLGLISILSKYRVLACNETVPKIELNVCSAVVSPKYPIKVKLENY